jgi:hypothetical protein
MDNGEWAGYELLEAAVPGLAKLAQTMRSQGRPVASATELVRVANAVVTGSVTTPHRLGIELGMSRDEVRRNAPTALFHNIQEVARGDAPGIFRL